MDLEQQVNDTFMIMDDSPDARYRDEYLGSIDLYDNYQKLKKLLLEMAKKIDQLQATIQVGDQAS